MAVERKNYIFGLQCLCDFGCTGIGDRNKKWITGHFRRTLISPRLYGVGKSQAMKDFKLLMYCR